MATHEIGIIMNGVTGRMGTNQHLIRSIVAIIEQGGIELENGDIIMPDPILVGRRGYRLKELVEENNLSRWTTDLDEALADDYNQIYFDSQTTVRRVDAIKKAIDAGKHIYCEKPTATNLEDAVELAQLAKEAGVKNGVVQDKLYLPGILKIKRLVEAGFFGEILAVRMEFGYWVFEGDWQEAQRPSWNYKEDEGGGIILDMYPHWSYVISDLFGDIKSVSTTAKTHIPKRIDENNEPYEVTAEDSAYGFFELENGIIVQTNSSWATRVDRDDLLTIQVDGTEGSAVAGLRECKTQHRVNTPKPAWNPDVPNPHDFTSQWEEVPNNDEFENAFKLQWELFLRHVVADEPYTLDLLKGAEGLQLADVAYQSSEEKRWVDVPEIKLD